MRNFVLLTALQMVNSINNTSSNWMCVIFILNWNVFFSDHMRRILINQNYLAYKSAIE